MQGWFFAKPSQNILISLYILPVAVVLWGQNRELRPVIAKARLRFPVKPEFFRFVFNSLSCSFNCEDYIHFDIFICSSVFFIYISNRKKSDSFSFLYFIRRFSLNSLVISVLLLEYFFRFSPNSSGDFSTCLSLLGKNRFEPVTTVFPASRFSKVKVKTGLNWLTVFPKSKSRSRD